MANLYGQPQSDNVMGQNANVAGRDQMASYTGAVAPPAGGRAGIKQAMSPQPPVPPVAPPPQAPVGDPPQGGQNGIRGFLGDLTGANDPNYQAYLQNQNPNAGRPGYRGAPPMSYHAFANQQQPVPPSRPERPPSGGQNGIRDVVNRW